MSKDNFNDRSVLSFFQDSGFYLRTGRKQAEEGNYVSALSKLRKAYEIDPTSIENIVAYAEILNRMQRFEESTRVLLLNESPDSLPSDGLFGLISDFLGMEEFIPAKRMLLLYLQKFPNGQYAETCKDYLSLFADKEEFSWQLGLDEGEDIELITHIHLSKAMHFSYLDKESLEYLESIVDRFPDSLWLQMEIALAEFFLNKQKEAEYRAINILKKDKDYIRAKCLLSYIRLNSNRKLEAIEILNSIRIPTQPDLEALGMLSSIFLETGLYEKAEQSTGVLMSFLPYDPLTIHQSAFAKYMLGKNAEALDNYRVLSDMDPHDTVADYYIDWISAHPIASEGVKGFITSYDVSYGEALERFHTMGHLFDNGVETAKRRWQSDSHLRDLFSWALCSPFIQSKKPIFYSLSSLNDHFSIDILKNYLLKIDQPDDEKQHAFSALQLMGYHESASLYFRGSWQFNVSLAPISDDIPLTYKKIKQRLIDLYNDSRFERETIVIAINYFDFYIQSMQGKYPRLNMFQKDAMIAALVYIALQTQQHAETPEKVAELFSVSLRRLHNAIERILYYLSDDQDDEERSQE